MQQKPSRRALLVLLFMSIVMFKADTITGGAIPTIDQTIPAKAMIFIFFGGGYLIYRYL